MDSPYQEYNMQKDKDSLSFQTMNTEKKVDQQMFNQIECLIQQQFQIFVPALVFEYKPSNNSTSRDFSGWDYDDLYEFFSHFGDIDLLEIYGKISVILFKTFIDAYTSREFLQNSSNFKEAEKSNFIVRWYSSEEECYVSEILKHKMKKYTSGQIVENITNNAMMWGNSNNSNNQSINNNYSKNPYNSYNNYNGNNTNGEFMPTNFNAQYNYYSAYSLNPSAKNEFNNIMNSSQRNYDVPAEDTKSYNSNSDKFLQNGKYTCKFEVQIENDNEFQVARRLIGAKVKFINKYNYFRAVI